MKNKNKIYCKDCIHFNDGYSEKCTFKEYVETIDSITGIKKTKSVFPIEYIESDFRYYYQFYNYNNNCTNFEKISTKKWWQFWKNN